MTGPVVVGKPNASSVLLVGQAPGDKEIRIGKPFAWSAGKTLFKWFQTIGMEEAQFRRSIYMAAVCRCFPGKNPKGGDRVPSAVEIDNCSSWLAREIEILQPRLIIAVGKLAIAQFIELEKLTDVVGHSHRVRRADLTCDLIPLPHPSGASTWHRREPGKALLEQGLQCVGRHPAWRQLCQSQANDSI